MGDLEGALNAYEQSLRHNQWSIPAMNAIACILRTKEQYPKAVEYLQSIIKLDPTSGETWGSLGMYYSAGLMQKGQKKTNYFFPLLGHCYLMMDNLQEAYTSYQQALYHLRDPKVDECPCILSLKPSLLTRRLFDNRNPNCGMELVFCTTAMAHLTTPKKPSLKSCAWLPTLKRQMRFISVSG